MVYRFSRKFLGVILIFCLKGIWGGLIISENVS